MPGLQANGETSVSKQDETVVAADESCSMSLEEHLELLVTAMTMFGLGIGCQTEYQTLLVLAEVSKRLNGWPDYDPGPKAEEIVKARRAYEEAQQKIQDARRDHLLFPAPDNGQVH